MTVPRDPITGAPIGGPQFANPWLHLGMGLLSAPNWGEGLARGIGSYRQTQTALAEEQQRRQQAEFERQRWQAKQAELEAMAEEQRSMREWAKSEGLNPLMPEWAMKEAFKARYGTTEAPANVREWEYFNQLPRQDQERYLQMKRATRWLDTGDRIIPAPQMPGSQPTVRTIPTEQGTVREIDYGTGSPAEWAAARQDVGGFQKTVPPEQRPELKGAQTRAQEEAKARVQKEQDAPGAIDKANEALNVINMALDHPGLNYAVGLSSILPIPPGTDAADFEAILDQLKGKAFLEAFESLKGGGHITEIEGQKATEAMARLSRKQSEAGFKTALRELANTLERGISRYKRSMPEGAQMPKAQQGRRVWGKGNGN